MHFNSPLKQEFDQEEACAERLVLTYKCPINTSGEMTFLNSVLANSYPPQVFLSALWQILAVNGGVPGSGAVNIRLVLP